MHAGVAFFDITAGNADGRQCKEDGVQELVLMEQSAPLRFLPRPDKIFTTEAKS